MLIWLSPDDQLRYGVNGQCLATLAKSGEFSQDNLFSTLLGLTGTEMKEYVVRDDILTACRGK